jgi:hypothetical protein
MSKSASQIKIERLMEHLEREKLGRAIDQQRHQQELNMEQQFRTSAMNELLAAFEDHEPDENGLKELVRILAWALRAAHPLRGAPNEDTMRVGHPELTSVEAAADAGGKRSMLKRWNKRLLKLASEFDNDLSGSDEPKRKMPPKPRCRRGSCDGVDQSLPYGSKVCPVCGQPLPAAA